MRKLQLCIGALIWIVVSSFGNPQAQTAPDVANDNGTTALKAKRQAPSAVTPVTGSGTPGQLTRWLGTDGSTFTIGNSIITENKFGLIGIGTTTPTSKLTVMGLIESKGAGSGVKFPDGTIQTTSASGALFGVAHDATLTGNGTVSLPLGFNVPLFLTGSVSFGGIIQVINNGDLGSGVLGSGGPGGYGVGGVGSNSINPIVSVGGGVFARGGDSNNSTGGKGVLAIGGQASGAGKSGGIGIEALGGGGLDGATNGLAGKFNGDVEVTGTLSKGAGSFKIDHPLDPENKYLYHSFVESPDMMNVYNGNITTDANGEAIVTLPDWFETLNKDFRYQLTVIGTFAQAIVGSEMKDNQFAIKTNAANVKVSWQVTGVRQDAYAKAHRIKVEEDKPEKERGCYLHPDVFNQPELMKEMKERREQMKREQKRTQPN